MPRWPNVEVEKYQGVQMSMWLNAKVARCLGGNMSLWDTGFVTVCPVDERRDAECRVAGCLGTGERLLQTHPLIGQELLSCISCPIRVDVCNNHSPLPSCPFAGSLLTLWTTSKF